MWHLLRTALTERKRKKDDGGECGFGAGLAHVPQAVVAWADTVPAGRARVPRNTALCWHVHQVQQGTAAVARGLNLLHARHDARTLCMRGERAEQAVHTLTEVLAPWDGELRLTNSRYTGSTSPYLTVVHSPRPTANVHW